MTIRRKCINRPFQIKAGSVKSDGTFEGHGSVFGELDSYRDIVVKGAFNDSLAKYESLGRNVPMLWQHDTRQPIGVYTELKEDDYGLFVRGQCNMEVQQGVECHALMKQGALSGLSIGYETVEDKWDDKLMARRLLKLNLWEISPVTFPAGDSARVNQVKAIKDMTEISQVEKMLRDAAGFSKSEACAFIARVKAIAGHGEHAGDEVAVVAKNVLQVLRGERR